MKNIKIVLMLLASLAVAACGGGGDGGLGNAVPTSSLNITTANQMDITRAVLNTTSGAAIDAFTVEDLLDALNNTPCLNGTMNLFSASSTAGTITFFDCSYVAGKIFRGTVTYSSLMMTPASIPLSPTAVSAKLNFDLTVTKAPNAPFTLLGDYSLNTSGLGTFTRTANVTSPTAGTLKVSSSITELLSDFGFQKTNASNTTRDNFFTLASSYLGGIVSYDTTTFFVTNDASNRTFPSAGEAIVTSAANSNQLRITILGDESNPPSTSSQVQVEFSLNGGSNYSAPVYYDWGQLFPSF